MWQLLSVLRIGLLICVIRKTQSCYDIVEKGKATEFSCTFSTNTTLITWQALAGNNSLNLTTCNMASSVCTDQLPSVYKGRVLSSVPGNYTMELNITSARVNETRFRCLADGGVMSTNCELEVYGLPNVVIYNRKCPVGPGVVGDYIKVGTSATCTCEVEDVGPSGGQAEWFAADGRSVGANTLSDRSSTLTMSYNASDPDVAYECRGTNPTGTYYVIPYKPKFPSPVCHVIVEKGQSTHLECPVQGPTNNLTWQVWAGGKYINVTTCTSAGACVDQISQVYKGHINASGVPQFRLDVISARSNETQFRCVTDDGKLVKICTLEPYRWPSTPTYGGNTLTNQYVEVTFSTVAYQYVHAVLHRRKIDVTNDDFDDRYCSANSSSSDPNSDYTIACIWRIPIANMLLSNTFYVEMSLLVTNQTLVNRPPVVSNDTLVSIGAVNVYLQNCPEEIKKGTSATCTCKISSSGFINTVQAQWFTGNERVFGAVDSSDGSSTLTVSYNPLGRYPSTYPTYQCRGTNPTREYPSITITYQPGFSSSPPGSAITWMLFLLAVCTGLSSTLF